MRSLFTPSRRRNGWWELPDRLVTDVDAALEQQILDLPQRGQRHEEFEAAALIQMDARMR